MFCVFTLIVMFAQTLFYLLLDFFLQISPETHESEILKNHLYLAGNMNHKE